MSTAGVVSRFTDVDDAPDAAWFIDFMDTVNALPEYRTIRQQLISELRVGVGSNVLDIGCGTGDDAREIQERVGHPGSVVGVDSSAAMIQVANSRNRRRPEPRFEVQRLEALDVPADSVDAVRAKLVLMHSLDADAALGEAQRVLKPGGRVALFDYDFDTTTLDHNNRQLTRDVIQALSDAHPGSWTARQTRRLLLDRGFCDVSVTPITVQMPWQVWSGTVKGRIQQSHADGVLNADADEIATWWDELAAAGERGVFHTSITGFLTAATK